MNDNAAKSSVVTEPPEILYVAKKRVACDGGEGALGHPRVFLEMGEEDRVECPYCDRLYIYRPDHSG
jgi:NADH dehydrogenase (ubiquinone) Fe-S protein 6